VTFQAIKDGDEPAPLRSRSFYHLQEVRQFLHVLGLTAEYIRDAPAGTHCGPFGILTNIALTEKAIKMQVLARSHRGEGLKFERRKNQKEASGPWHTAKK